MLLHLSPWWWREHVVEVVPEGVTRKQNIRTRARIEPSKACPQYLTLPAEDPF